MSFVPLFFVSIIAGLMGSISGMGGGVVLIPVLTAFGIDIKRAIAISILSVIVVSNSAAPSYVRRHIPNLRVTAFLEVFAVLGSLFGAYLTLVSRRRFLFFLCGGILLVSWLRLWRKRDVQYEPAVSQDALSRWLGLEGSYYDEAEKQTKSYQVNGTYLAAPLMFGAGVISGLLGIGGSAMTVLIQDAVMKLPVKVSLTTSNLIIGVMALSGAGVYLEAGLVDPKLVVPMILGVSIGAYTGSKLLVRLSNPVVRVLFLLVFVLLGIEMILHGMRGGW